MNKLFRRVDVPTAHCTVKQTATPSQALFLTSSYSGSLYLRRPLASDHTITEDVRRLHDNMFQQLINLEMHFSVFQVLGKDKNIRLLIVIEIPCMCF